jgi:hypothetical protein
MTALNQFADNFRVALDGRAGDPAGRDYYEHGAEPALEYGKGVSRSLSLRGLRYPPFSKKHPGYILSEKLCLPDVAAEHDVARMAGLRPDPPCRDPA